MHTTHPTRARSTTTVNAPKRVTKKTMVEESLLYISSLYVSFCSRKICFFFFKGGGVCCVNIYHMCVCVSWGEVGEGKWGSVQVEDIYTHTHTHTHTNPNPNHTNPPSSS
jgi:hypothetical protein